MRQPHPYRQVKRTYGFSLDDTADEGSSILPFSLNAAQWESQIPEPSAVLRRLYQAPQAHRLFVPLLPDRTQAGATLWRAPRDSSCRGFSRSPPARSARQEKPGHRHRLIPLRGHASFRQASLGSGFGAAGCRARFSTGNRGSSLSLGLKSGNSLGLPRKGRRHSWPVPIT